MFQSFGIFLWCIGDISLIKLLSLSAKTTFNEIHSSSCKGNSLSTSNTHIFVFSLSFSPSPPLHPLPSPLSSLSSLYLDPQEWAPNLTSQRNTICLWTRTVQCLSLKRRAIPIKVFLLINKYKGKWTVKSRAKRFDKKSGEKINKNKNKQNKKKNKRNLKK